MLDLGKWSVVITIVSIIQIVGYFVACAEIPKIAKDKGHEQVSSIVLFFFGLPYMIYVASLPDLKARKAETKNIFDNTSVVNNPSVTNSSATNTYNSSSTANVGYNNTSNPKTNRPSKNGESNLEQWICPECKWINTGTHKGCQKCGYGSYEKNSAVGGWTCPECGCSNLINRITCSKCGIKKPL